MKKSILIIFLSLCVIGLKAQSWVYQPFPTTTAVWRSHHTSSSGTDDVIKMQMEGDTILGGFACKKLYNVSTGFYYWGALRQDIPAKKVYYTPPSLPEELLYDFNLTIGDTVRKTPGLDTLLVSSIDSTLVGANFHKIFIISGTNPANDPADIVEGVGYTSDLFWDFEYTFENVWMLECFAVDNAARMFPYPGTIYPYQCFITVGMGELEEGKLNVLPNPIKDIATISITCGDNYSIEVIGMLGQIIYRNKVSGTFFKSIDFSDFNNGIYFVRLSDTKGNSVVKKVVKQ